MRISRTAATDDSRETPWSRDSLLFPRAMNAIVLVVAQDSVGRDRSTKTTEYLVVRHTGIGLLSRVSATCIVKGERHE